MNDCVPVRVFSDSMPKPSNHRHVTPSSFVHMLVNYATELQQMHHGQRILFKLTLPCKATSSKAPFLTYRIRSLHVRLLFRMLNTCPILSSLFRFHTRSVCCLCCLLVLCPLIYVVLSYAFTSFNTTGSSGAS